MEVFIAGVPHRETEKSLNSFLKGVLAHLQMEDWMCQKPSHKNWAKLIFLDPNDGLRFLSLHGQTKNFAGRYCPVPGSTYLIFKGHQLKCSLSNKMDKFALRSLEMDRKARAEQKIAPVISDETSSRKDYRTLPCASISCGLWDYVESELVFKPYLTLTEPITMTFNAKSIVFKMHTGQRLDISYYGIDSVAWEGLPSPAIVFTLREAPRFFQYDDTISSTQSQDLIGWMESLSIFEDRDLPESNGPNRKRLPGFTEDHQKTAGSCLVYRLLLTKKSELDNQMKALGQVRGMPPLLRRQINIRVPRDSYAVEFGLLLKQLSPETTVLPFPITFQLRKLAQNGYLPPSRVIALLPEVKRMALRSDRRVCVSAIRRLFQQIPFAGPDAEPECFEPQFLMNLLRKNEEQSKSDGLFLEEPVASENVAVIHKAKITPAGVYLYGPAMESNNRVLRKYPTHHDYFLRVQFCDEDGLPVRFNAAASNGPIYDRFREILNKGIPIAGLHFAFLGFSHSSLRAQSCWFMAPFFHNGSLLYDRELINGLGNFSQIRSPARCAARIGQAFSDTRDAIALAPGVVKEMRDVERHGRIFSDGVGTISREALEQIWDGLLAGKKKKPTVLQIRYQGAKGMLALDSRLQGKSLFLRPSMIKFRESNSTDLEICEAGYKPLPLYLNQPMIKILEDMGVEHKFFMDLQAMEVERLRMTTSNTRSASKFLKTHSVGEKIDLPWFVNRLPRLQLSFQDDDFLMDVVEAAVLIELRALKYKARIPVKDGYTLFGVMDETGILEEGQIFCIVEVDGKARVITGKDGRRPIITRSPALHPGDIQLATAVTVPADSPLMQLRNCICFSQKGSRDLPSKLSGGDLDGDKFHIIFDTNALPKEAFLPAEYPRQTPRELDREVNRQDMTDFFVKFMETDQLGRICNVHKIIADQSDEGVRDPSCVKLAQMASTAVDFSKTGIPVEERMPYYNPLRPHFMAPGPHVNILKEKPISFEDAKSTNDRKLEEEEEKDDDDFRPYKYYPSSKILGKLYSAIDEREIFQHVQQSRLEQSSHHDGVFTTKSVLEDVWNCVNSRFLFIMWEGHLERARCIRDEYEECLFDIMFEFGPSPQRPLSEVEVFVGNIIGKSGAQTTRQRELSMTMKERFGADLSFIVKCITRSASQGYEREEGGDGEAEEDLGAETSQQDLALSMACLWVGLKEKAGVWEYGKRGKVELHSFAYVAAAVCLKEAEKF